MAPIGAARAARAARVSSPVLSPQSGLDQHYDATKLTLSDGNTVSTWPDESGNNNDATALGAPTYRISQINGKPVVRLDGVDDYFEISSITAGDANTIFAVINVNDTAKENYIYSGGYDNTDSFLLFNTPSGANEYSFIASGGSTINASTAPSGTPELLMLIREGDGSTRMYLDGTEILNTTTTQIADATHDHHIGWAEPRNKAGTELDADIGELARYDRAVTSAERTEIENYVSDKWGITI